MSILKALPTRAEVAESGCSDAGQYMRKLHNNQLTDSEGNTLDVSAFFGRATPWGVDPMSPIPEMVDHTLAIIIRAIHVLTEPEPDDFPLELTSKQLSLWRKRLGR